MKFKVTICETRFFYTTVEMEARSEEEIEAMSQAELNNYFLEMETDPEWKENLDYTELSVTEVEHIEGEQE